MHKESGTQIVNGRTADNTLPFRLQIHDIHFDAFHLWLQALIFRFRVS